MGDSANSFHSTRLAARIEEMRWPSLRKSLLGATDAWLGLLETINVSGRPTLTDREFGALSAFLANFNIRASRSTMRAMSRIFLAQERHLLLRLGDWLPDAHDEAAAERDEAEAGGDDGGIVMVVDAEPDQAQADQGQAQIGRPPKPIRRGGS